jgi:hypothetical protein
MIRKAVLKADDKFTDDTIALAERLEDVDGLFSSAILDVPEFNCMQTSWVDFDPSSHEWGPVLSERVEDVCTPHDGVAHGSQTVLLRVPDGEIEVLVDVEGPCLDRLLTDPLFTKFSVAR